MADLDGQVGLLWRVGNPMRAADPERTPGVIGEFFGVGDQDRVIVEILADHVPGPAAETKAAALADGMEPSPPVMAEDLTARGAADLARAIAEVVADEVVERNPAEEADSLAVGPVGVGEPETVSLFSNPRFGEITDREQTSRELFLRELAQEVGLILLWVGSAKQVKSAIALFDLSVVA